VFSSRASTIAILISGCGLMLAPLRADIAGIGLFASIDGPFVSSEAIYSSTILGGGLFGNNVGFGFSPGESTAGVVTNPGVMIPGLFAGSIDLTDLTYGKESFAGGSLATGATHVLANSCCFPQQVAALAQLEDGLVFHVPGGGTANVAFGVALDGTQNTLLVPFGT
jgi:hypothetical protein